MNLTHKLGITPPQNKTIRINKSTKGTPTATHVQTQSAYAKAISTPLMQALFGVDAANAGADADGGDVCFNR